MSIDLYMSHFGFSERPFTLLPDPDFLFWSPSHTKAYTILEYGIASRSPLTVVTGEVGAGKTTLVQKLLSEIEDDITVGLISNAQAGRGELLRWVLYSLGLEPDDAGDYVSMFRQFQNFVIEEYTQGRYVVVVIDEAQNLSVEALEDLRMFTNINSNKYELLQLILVGQPELRQIIEAPSLSQFAQRVMASYHLNGLDREGTGNYIRHRLRHVGGSGNEFTSYAIDRIYKESGGIPRIINKLCELSLVYAAAGQAQSVDLDTVRELVADGIVIKSANPDVLVLQGQLQAPNNKAAE